MKKYFLYSIIIIIFCAATSASINVTDVERLWIMNNSDGNDDIYDSVYGEYSLKNYSGAFVGNYSECVYNSCFLSDGSNDYYSVDKILFQDGQNYTYMVWLNPVQAESTYDFYGGMNDGLYFNYNSGLNANLKDGAGYDSFIISNTSFDNTTYRMAWIYTLQNATGWFYCGSIDDNDAVDCQSFDGTFATNDYTRIGSHQGANPVVAYYQAMAIWNRTLNTSERTLVHDNLLDGNTTYSLWYSDSVEEESANATGTDLTWDYYPKTNFYNTTTQVISFRGSNVTNYTIEYGETVAYGTTINDSSSQTYHNAYLNDLSANTLYFYRVNITFGSNTSSYQSNFTTKKSGLQDFSFCQLSDIHVGAGSFSSNTEPRFRSILQICKDQGVDFIVFTGDIIEGTSYPDYYNNYKNLSLILKEVVPEIPLYAVPGNHDWSNGVGGNHQAWQQFYIHPENDLDVSGYAAILSNETIYAFNYSYGCFVGKQDYINVSVGSGQFEYINDSLSNCDNSTQWFRAVFSHAPYNASPMNESWNDYLTVYKEENALDYVGHFHGAGYNISMNTMRVSSIYEQWQPTDYFSWEEWYDVEQAHFSITSVNASVAQIDIYNETEVIHTVYWNNTDYQETNETEINASYTSFSLSDSALQQNSTLTITQIIDNGTETLDQIWFTLNDTQLNVTAATNGTNIIYWPATYGEGTYNITGHFNTTAGTVYNSSTETFTITLPVPVNISISGFSVSPNPVVQNNTVTVSATLDNGSFALDKFWITINSTIFNLTTATNGTNTVYFIASQTLGAYNITAYANDTNGVTVQTSTTILTISEETPTEESDACSDYIESFIMVFSDFGSLLGLLILGIVFVFIMNRENINLKPEYIESACAAAIIAAVIILILMRIPC